MKKVIIDNDNVKVEMEVTEKHGLKFNGKVKYPRKFEVISQGFSRCKVPGGWLVNSYDSIVDYKRSGVGSSAVGMSESMVFVSDPGYEWVLEDAFVKDEDREWSVSPVVKKVIKGVDDKLLDKNKPEIKEWLAASSAAFDKLTGGDELK